MASLRENIGYDARMFSCRREAVMIFSQDRALLNAQTDLQDLITLARQSADEGMRIDQVERELMRGLLALRLTFLQLFIAQHGDGDLGEEVTAADGHVLQRLPKFGRDTDLRQLLGGGPSALVLAVGAWRHRALPIPGVDGFAGRGFY
jgi:hypothetical protein